jgi:hypothetical protein
MKPFNFPVQTPDEACLLLEVLALYDLFQLENNVKPDYANAGGLNIYEDGDWVEWYDQENDLYINDYMRRKKSNKK